MYIGRHVKYPLFLSDFNETGIISTGFKKYTHITKLHENPSSRSGVDSYEQKDARTERRTDRHTDRHDEANRRFWQFCERA